MTIQTVEQGAPASVHHTRLLPVDVSEIRDNYTRLGLHNDNIPEGYRCYCPACIEKRNADFRSGFCDEMLRLGFTDADTFAEARKHFGDFYDDIVFIWERIRVAADE